MLADPGRTISKRHCVIEEAELGYELTDLSINGVFLNDEDEPVGVGNTRRLRHGDRFRIGPSRVRPGSRQSGGSKRTRDGAPPARSMIGR